jgi:hypothetical protein
MRVSASVRPESVDWAAARGQRARRSDADWRSGWERMVAL